MIPEQTARYEISTHALHEEGDESSFCGLGVQDISTHALHEEGDLNLLLGYLGPKISTHALHEEGDCKRSVDVFCSFLFLPTPSTRRATRPGAGQRAGRPDFYPRPPRGGRPIPIGKFSSAP